MSNPQPLTVVKKPKVPDSPIQVAAKIEKLLKTLTPEQRKMVLSIVQ